MNDATNLRDRAQYPPESIETSRELRLSRLGHAALAAYAGTYEGVELDSRYRVEAGDSTLLLRARAGPGLEARPVFADAFVSGQYTIQFVRKNGRVTGFEVSHPRARGVKFVKLSY